MRPQDAADFLAANHDNRILVDLILRIRELPETDGARIALIIELAEGAAGAAQALRANARQPQTTVMLLQAALDRFQTERAIIADPDQFLRDFEADAAANAAPEADPAPDQADVPAAVQAPRRNATQAEVDAFRPDIRARDPRYHAWIADPDRPYATRKMFRPVPRSRKPPE